jgi:hypothetical protein
MMLWLSHRGDRGKDPSPLMGEGGPQGRVRVSSWPGEITGRSNTLTPA